MQSPASLSSDPILSLSANGVSDETLSSLLKASIQADVQIFEPMTNPHSSEILWDSVYSTCRVAQTRLQQIISPELQRSQGFLERDQSELDDNVSSTWSNEPDPSSGAPASTEDQLLGLLQAGFDSHHPLVLQKLYDLQERNLKSGLEASL